MRTLEGAKGLDGTNEETDAGRVSKLFVEHSPGLKRFLLGVLKDSQAAEDALQAAFVKALEKENWHASDDARAWLYKVAFNEAMLIRRRGAVHQKATQRLAWLSRGQELTPDEKATQKDSVERIRALLLQLPIEQQTVVRMRIEEGKTFAEIAASEGLAIGTVLTRMRLALERLRTSLGEEC